MAISGGDGSIILTTKVDETGLKKGLGSIKKIGATAGKAFLAIGAAAATATVAITKMATDAYAEYEQLVGGVETLFKGSAQKVIAYAENAFYTAGVSANEYMKQVTSFSASLIRSTAGDTDKAADIANMALIDISDNVNKMGSSMESVTLAYQGFAKQQYMLLDNLKLGYGGTKTEMERLLKDAQALTGVKYDINNLADVYSAIHAIQEQLGIAGTTAKEAEKTISGSANMMKAAWQNVLSAIAGGGDLDRAINNLVYSIQKYFENIVPVVERSLVGIGRLIEKVAPMLVQNVASALIQAIPSLLNAVYQMIIGLAKGIFQGIKALFSGGSNNVVSDIKSSVGGIADSAGEASAGIEEMGDAIEKAGKQAKKALAGFDEINTLSSNASESAGGLAMNTVLPSNVGGITVESDTKKAEEQLLTFFDKIKKAMEPLIKVTKEWVEGLNFEGLTNGIKSLLEPLKELGTFAQEVLFWAYTNVFLPLSTWSINEYAPVLVDALKNVLDGLRKILEPIWSGFQTLFENMKPIFDWIGETVIDIIQSLGDMFSNVGKVFEEKGDKIQEIFDNIGKAIQWVWEIIEPIFNWIKDIVLDVFGTVDEIIGGVIDTLYDLISFLKYVFKGDWENAWNSIVSVFKNIVNIIIDALNILIRGVNKIKFDVPDWVPAIGGQKWGFDIPKIPRLATGAVIPPNKQFMAILGDNTREHEIVSPISTMKEAVAEVLAQANIGGGFNGRIEVPVSINGREILRAVRDAENDVGRQTVFGGFANVH